MNYRTFIRKWVWRQYITPHPPISYTYSLHIIRLWCPPSILYINSPYSTSYTYSPTSPHHTPIPPKNHTLAFLYHICTATSYTYAPTQSIHLCLHYIIHFLSHPYLWLDCTCVLPTVYSYSTSYHSHLCYTYHTALNLYKSLQLYPHQHTQTQLTLLIIKSLHYTPFTLVMRKSMHLPSIHSTDDHSTTSH